MGVFAGVLSFMTGSLLQFALTIVLMGLLVYVIGELVCKLGETIPILGDGVATTIVSGIGSIPVLGFPMTFTSCYDSRGLLGKASDICHDATGGIIPCGHGTQDMRDAGAAGLDTEKQGAGDLGVGPGDYGVLDDIPGLSDMLHGFEDFSRSECYVRAGQLDAILRHYDKVQTESERAAAHCIARSWLEDTKVGDCKMNDADCAGPNETLGVSQYGILTSGAEFGDQGAGDGGMYFNFCQAVATARKDAMDKGDLGTDVARIVEEFDHSYCGGKFAGRVCDACNDGVACNDNLECRRRLPTEEDCGGAGRDLTGELATDPDAPRCRPVFDCGTGLAVGVGGRRCGGGKYCKHAPGQTVGKCTELPPELSDCTETGGCSLPDLGPGWGCVPVPGDKTGKMHCVQNCGPLGLPGTDKRKCICRPASQAELDANDGVNPYGSSPGYDCIELSAIDLDHPDYEALAQIYGTDIPSFGRQIIPVEKSRISNRLLRARDGEVYVVLYGVKYWVQSSCIPSETADEIPSVESPGQFRGWTAYTNRWYNGRPIPQARAAPVVMEWSEVINTLESVPFPDGRTDPAARSDWPIDEVYPDMCYLIQHGVSLQNAVPYKKYKLSELEAMVAQAEDWSSWSAQYMTPGVSAYEDAECPPGKVVTGLDLSANYSGSPKYKIRCGDPPAETRPTAPDGDCDAALGRGLMGSCSDRAGATPPETSYLSNMGFGYTGGSAKASDRRLLGTRAGGTDEGSTHVYRSAWTTDGNAFPNFAGAGVAACPDGYAVSGAEIVPQQGVQVLNSGGSSETRAPLYRFRLRCSRPERPEDDRRGAWTMNARMFGDADHYIGNGECGTKDSCVEDGKQDCRADPNCAAFAVNRAGTWGSPRAGYLYQKFSSAGTTPNAGWDTYTLGA